MHISSYLLLLQATKYLFIIILAHTFKSKLTNHLFLSCFIIPKKNFITVTIGVQQLSVLKMNSSKRTFSLNQSFLLSQREYSLLSNFSELLLSLWLVESVRLYWAIVLDELIGLRVILVLSCFWPFRLFTSGYHPLLKSMTEYLPITYNLTNEMQIITIRNCESFSHNSRIFKHHFSISCW